MKKKMKQPGPICGVGLCALLVCMAVCSAQPEVFSLETGPGLLPDPQYLPDFPDFGQYVEVFEKGYEEGTVEYLTREEIYNGWKHHWMQEYETGELTYLVGATERSDWTVEERNRTKPDSEHTNMGRQDHIRIKQKVSQSTANTPSSIDWRSKGIITSVKNQGSCGSCWTFATAAYGEARLIQKKEKGKDIDLSEQYLLSCTPDCSCNGGYLQYVFQEASNGIPEQNTFPYDPNGIVSPFICWSNKKEKVGYVPFKEYDLSDSELESLLQEGPLAISISATDWEDYKGGIFKCRPSDRVNHAVLLVGYNRNSWIIKNQWGRKWGEEGYIRVTKDRSRNCKVGTSAFWMWESTSSCGLLAILLALIALHL